MKYIFSFLCSNYSISTFIYLYIKLLPIWRKQYMNFKVNLFVRWAQIIVPVAFLKDTEKEQYAFHFLVWSFRIIYIIDLMNYLLYYDIIC